MFEKTETKSFVIPNAADGSAVAAVDLGYNSKALVLRCADCSAIPAATNLAVFVAESAGDDLCAVYAGDTGLIVSLAMPAVGTWRLVLPDGFGARRVRLVLSAVVTADTTFEISGVDAGV
jgi:hypothetical protein